MSYRDEELKFKRQIRDWFNKRVNPNDRKTLRKVAEAIGFEREVKHVVIHRTIPLSRKG